MIVSFFESFKYVGHFVPIAFLRVFLGYLFIQIALDNYNGSFLTQPILANMISESLPQSSAPGWYEYYMSELVLPNWVFFAYSVTYVQFLIGISYILGFFVRPISLVAALLALNYTWLDPKSLSLHQIYLILFLIMGWLGAGRCLGIDYFFFKRNRGIWW